MRSFIFATLLMVPAATFAQEATRPASTQVAVHVAVTTPVGAPRALVEAGMERSAPTYTAVTGLIRKYFTIGQADFGGIYLFTDRASAQAWFSDAWRARAAATYGSQPVVTYFDVPLVVDNSAAK